MNQTSFQVWRAQHPLIENSLTNQEPANPNWCRIYAYWYEKNQRGQDLTHLYAFNLHLPSGEIYTDCSKRKIWAKCVCLSLIRPFFGLAKTVYHSLLPLSLTMIVFNNLLEGKQQDISLNIIVTKIWQELKANMADIVRTPLYTLALLIMTVTATLIGPSSNQLYDLRAMAGRLEVILNRGQQNSWTLALCFQPLDNLMTIDELDYKKGDTDYEDDPTLHGLNNLARSLIRFRRESWSPFNDCGILQPKEVPYISVNF